MCNNEKTQLMKLWIFKFVTLSLMRWEGAKGNLTLKEHLRSELEWHNLTLLGQKTIRLKVKTTTIAVTDLNCWWSNCTAGNANNGV